MVALGGSVSKSVLSRKTSSETTDAGTTVASSQQRHDVEAQTRGYDDDDDHDDHDVLASVLEDPDAETVGDEGDDGASSKGRQQSVSPKQFLWMIIVSLAALIFVIFVVLLCMFAFN
jgi:hypothetical protein